MKAHEIGRAIMQRCEREPAEVRTFPPIPGERASEAALRKLEGTDSLERLARVQAIIDGYAVTVTHESDREIAEAILTELGLWP